jgi:hypothetical protein
MLREKIGREGKGERERGEREGGDGGIDRENIITYVDDVVKGKLHVHDVALTQ